MSDNENTEPFPEDRESPAATPPADDQPRMAALEAEIGDLKDKLLRAMAEGENIRRRADREREDTAKFAISKFAQNLLPVADNLRRAVEAIPEGHNNELLTKVIEGIEGTERALLAAFEKSGIVKIEALDKPFDANFHEVMIEMDYPEKVAGTIVQLFETGYLIEKRLLRPARVAVSKGGPRDRLDTNA